MKKIIARNFYEIEIYPSVGENVCFPYAADYFYIKADSIPWKFVEIDKGLFLRIAISHKLKKIAIGNKILEIEHEPIHRRTTKTKQKS